MLLRHRPPGIDPRPPKATPAYETLDTRWLSVLSWLSANRIEFVVVGAVAEAARGRRDARGPVAIVPAPYGRNHERLARALAAGHARVRIDPPSAGQDTMPVKMTPEKLGRGLRWTLRCGEYDLDVEGLPPGAPRYQELLYEAGRFGLAEGLSVEVASPEDIEHYRHLSRTGTSPEIRIERRPAPAREPAGQ